MDMKDYWNKRFFRPTVWKSEQLGTANVGVLKITASMNRWGLFFLSPGTNTVIWYDADDAIDVASGLSQPGIQVGTNTMPILITEEQHGDIVHKAWKAVSTVLNLPLAWVEIMHPILEEKPRGILQQPPY